MVPPTVSVGLTSFLPTLFHDQYGVPKAEIGKYSTGIIVMASILRVAGGWIADHLGGIRTLSLFGTTQVPDPGSQEPVRLRNPGNERQIQTRTAWHSRPPLQR